MLTVQGYLSFSCVSGILQRAFGTGFGGFGGFSSTSTKPQRLRMLSSEFLEVNHSKNNMKCSLKFGVAQPDGDSEWSSRSSYYDDCNLDYD